MRQAITRLIPRALKQRLASSLEWARLPLAARQEIKADRSGRLFIDAGAAQVIAPLADWLLDAQRLSSTDDGGYARHYSLVSGWGQSYPETTGYIIPTLLDVAAHLHDQKYAQSARTALDWCRKIQFPDGGFQGGIINAQPLVPVTFNTGQILIGLAAGVRHFNDYHDATRRAAHWLADSLDTDGCWRRYPTPFAAPGDKTYETHVSWGLFEAARALGDGAFGAAGLRNVAWALTKQQANGWFADCCLSNPAAPLTHTIGYALRGIIEAHRYAPSPTLLAAAENTAQALLGVIEPSGRIAGCFDAQWRPAAAWSCVTGAVQIAACWFLLFELTGKRAYLEAGRRANHFFRRTLHLDGPSGLRGGVKGSYPVDGEYGRFELLNWANKFAIDANLMELRHAGA